MSFFAKKQFLLVQNESNNFERDWAQVLADPIVKDHFGPGWTINDGGPTLVGLNLALEYDFPGSKDTLEYFKSVFHDYYEVLCKISTGYSGQTLPLYQLILVHAELPKTQIQKQLCELGGGFLRAILWFAKQKYEEDIENSCSKTLDVGLGFALQRFILDDLLPVVDPCWLNTDSFRRSQLYSHSVDLVLQKNRSDIVQLFKHCQQSNVVSLDRWVSILSKYALINHVCKRKHAVRAFKLSLPVRAMSISNVDTCETLGFFRFCEALGRFAALDTLILPTREELTFIGVKNTAEFYQLMALLDKELPDRAKCIWHLFEAKKQHVNLATRLGQLFQVLFCKTEGTREHVFSNHLERLDSIFERFQNQEPPLQAALAIEAFFISHATLLPHEEYNIVHQRFGI
uniref:Uncharacterized protein n=1 Tax=Mucochytrium quahogii TaxID=96639 RepID=A0A7S2WL46_9STRA|mmetsp:Transcript_356/g.811  ORF Transcript_356/g.811 Transcript_356/m.811 type:complete len:401 (+) Transcript_356:1202-2404(+)